MVVLAGSVVSMVPVDEGIGDMDAGLVVKVGVGSVRGAVSGEVYAPVVTVTVTVLSGVKVVTKVSVPLEVSVPLGVI